jgi:hypothetical protein
MGGRRGGLLRSGCAAAVVCVLASRAMATGVPVGGFLPLVGIALTDEFLAGNDPEWDFFSHDSPSPGGTFLGAGGPHYDLALLDTGAAVSLLTTASDAAFNIDDGPSGGSDGYRGTNELTIGGASGFLQATIGDPLGLYAGGLQARTPGATLVMPNAALEGQTNTSLLTIPPESDLPNVLGLTYAHRYATRIRNDQPQIFQHEGQTVRAPGIEFAPLASGGTGAGPGGANIVRRAPMVLNPGASFTTAPFYFPDFFAEDIHEDPAQPTIIQGGMFLNINASMDGGPSLGNTEFFFDTGADVTVLSEFTALQLGFDTVLDTPDFTVAIVGSGGTKLDVPGFFLDHLTIPANGGSLVADRVPVIVLNVTNPADPGNVVAGIVGTNVLSGRNLVIDPDPSIGGGNLGPQLYISDPVTTEANWSSAAASASWGTGGSWSTGVTPGVLHIANVRHVSGGNQEAVFAANATAWEVNVSGASAGQTMTLRLQSGVTLTTFAGLNVEQHGHMALGNGVLDVQNVDIRDGGRMSGVGSIRTGSGPIPGQVENVSGVVAPGPPGAIIIEGRFSNGVDGTLEIGVLGFSTHGTLVVNGPATIAGTLRVVLPGANPYVPQLGEMHTILSAPQGLGGQFDAHDLAPLPEGRMWRVGYTDTSVILQVTLPGDFDGDDDVDTADLVDWRAGYGTIYSGADFLLWQRYLGSRRIATAVPESATLSLMIIAATTAAGVRRKRRG